MRAYTVHAPPTAPGSVPAPERFAFVKDGFSWPALLFGPFWILWHRLWLALMAYVIAALLLAWTERLAGSDIATLIAGLGGLLFALEANNIRRWSLARRGWRELGAAHGGSLEEAEIGFFSRRRQPPQGAPAEPDAPRRDTPWSREPSGRVDHEGPIFGLFPEPEH